MTSVLASMMIFLATALGPQAPVESPAAGPGKAVKAPAAAPSPTRLDPAHGILWDDKRLLENVSRIA